MSTNEKIILPLADVAKVVNALHSLVYDLELRASMKRGDEKNVVDVGQGVYFQAKTALKDIEQILKT